MASPFANLWPKIVDADSAEKTITVASQAAFFVAGITALVAAIAIVNGPFLGFDGWSMVDAALMAVAGWRIKRHSRAWAVVAVVYWAYSIVIKVMTVPASATGGVLVSLFILMAFVGGARGAFALPRYQKVAPGSTVVPA
ncbi:MAG TPA: hypothetical protein VF921_10910 [Vicinamibacterales bacterium]